MPSERPGEYLDANVLLAYIDGEADRVDVVEQVLTEAGEGRRSLVTSTLSIVEVAYASGDDGPDLSDASEEAIERLWVPSSPIMLIEPSVAVMRRARRLLRDTKQSGPALKPADAIHLASAVIVPNVEVLLTYENEKTRARWAEVTGLTVIEPVAIQPRLPME